MSLLTSTTRTFRPFLLAIAALAFSIMLTLTNRSVARAQSDDNGGDVASAPSAADQPAANADDSEQTAKADADQKAHAAADEAEAALETATEQRNALESSNAPQDQIDAANDAVTQARADKDAADAAAQKADEDLGQ